MTLRKLQTIFLHDFVTLTNTMNFLIISLDCSYFIETCANMLVFMVCSVFPSSSLSECIRISQLTLPF